MGLKSEAFLTMRNSVRLYPLSILDNPDFKGNAFVRFKNEARLSKLNDVAIYQMQLLVEMPPLSNLPSGEGKEKIE